MHINSILKNNNYNKTYGTQPANKVSFKAVSIDPDSLYTMPNGKVISDGNKKINTLLNNGNIEEIDKLNIDFQNITEEMKIRRKIANELPWWRHTQKALRNITKFESDLKNRTMKKQDKAVSDYISRVQKIDTIANEVATKVTANNIDPEYKRLKQHREFDDYKGSFTKANGFKKIAGYNTEKDVLNRYFISEIKKEQKGEPANVPNAVLFFGPTGNGKTTFAKAFANETGCKLVPIRTKVEGNHLNDRCNIFYKTLLEKAQKAEENFQKTGIRTIIFIDEITKVADKDSSILPELAEFFANCSKKYHCTMFCASNHPLNIGLPMEGENAVFPYIVSMDPPDLNNKAEIMHYYLNGRVEQNLDYSKLADYMDKTEKEKQGIFNISQIKDDICLEGTEKKMTEEDVLKNIEKSKPNITRDDLDKYSDEMDKLIKNEVKE